MNNTTTNDTIVLSNVYISSRCFQVNHYWLSNSSIPAQNKTHTILSLTPFISLCYRWIKTTLNKHMYYIVILECIDSATQSLNIQMKHSDICHQKVYRNNGGTRWRQLNRYFIADLGTFRLVCETGRLCKNWFTKSKMSHEPFRARAGIILT